MKTTNQLKLAAAVAAGLALVGCGSSSDNNNIVETESFYKETVIDSACFATNTCTASGFVFPENAIFVAPNAQSGTDITADIDTALFNATPGTTIVLPKGTFKVDSSIMINDTSKHNNLTLVGHGIKSTTLNFSDCSLCDDGVHFEGVEGIVIRDMSVNEAGKNGIKAVNVDGIHFNYTATVWEGDLTLETKSAYGLYPVESDNIVIENSYARGSNDAGIYVGQSNDIVVRNNVAEYNIAGIEIENSNRADVYNNIATLNSGGLLSFDLPSTNQKFGLNTRWFNNKSYDNNTPNVGPGTVGQVPTGTGILVLATNDVEIYNNEIYNNKTNAVAITSYFLIEGNTAAYGPEGSLFGDIAGGWTPLTRNVQVHDNVFSNNTYAPALDSLLGDAIAAYTTGNHFNSLVAAQQGEQAFAISFPTIIYDGVGELQANSGAFSDLVNAFAVDMGPYDANDRHCIYDNTFVSADGFTPYIGSLYDATGTYGADPVMLSSVVGNQATLLNCGENPNPRLSASTATIRGVVYGCGTGGDDENSEPACAL